MNTEVERKMFDKAGSRIFNNARELRNNLTESEIIFWTKLKSFLPEYKFRRQHPIGNFIADFYCHSLKLVIEIDGYIHQLPHVTLSDTNKQQYLESIGLTVLRYTNDEAVNQFEIVGERIIAHINSQNAVLKSKEK
jgi:imidazole glycerol-phosphate synthase subunit HisF